MGTFSFKKIIGTVLTFGKQHAPELMTGGGIALGWVGVYIFWKQSRKAEKCIAEEESKLNTDESGEPLDIPEDEKQTLSVKEKFVIYLHYCYLSLIFGVMSSGLVFWANRIQASQLIEAMMLTKLVTDKDAEKKDYVKSLEEEVGEKKTEELRMKTYRERFSAEDIVSLMREMMEDGDDRTIFIDSFTGSIFPQRILDVSNAIAELNSELRFLRETEIKKKKKFNDPYYVSESPWWNDDAFDDVYSTVDLSKFLYRLGEASKRTGCRIGELVEFHYYGGSDMLKQSDILVYEPLYKTYFSKDEVPPEVCYIDYSDYLSPSMKALDR